MASPVVKTLISGNNKLVINVTKVYDGGGHDADDIIIDRSALTGPNGAVPTKVRIDDITWSISPGFDYVLLEFDDDGGDEAIEYLQGQGYMDYRPFGGKSMAAAPTLVTDGDVVLTTVGTATTVDAYSLLINCTLKD